MKDIAGTEDEEVVEDVVEDETRGLLDTAKADVPDSCENGEDWRDAAVDVDELEN